MTPKANLFMLTSLCFRCGKQDSNIIPFTMNYSINKDLIIFMAVKDKVTGCPCIPVIRLEIDFGRQ